MMSPVEQIKEKLSVEDVISSYVKLEHSGNSLKARCPFHNEKTASFYISQARGSYHCFGCNRGGDIFTFIEEIEGVDFSGALKILAARAGITLSYQNAGEDNNRKKLFAIMQEATCFYEDQLACRILALNYLKERGLTEKTIKDFRLGYAPAEWRAVFDHLVKKGYVEADIEMAGLAIKSAKGWYDRFRGRIMFPVNDSQGHPVAFSGRIFEGEENGIKSNNDTPVAKYINSPETPLYHKSSILFGYDKAKRALLQAETTILVEGQFDLILSHQAGFANTVASSGTALTSDHLNLIMRFCKCILLAFDADEAGQKAMHRAVELAFPIGIEVKIIALPEGSDPADLIQKDKVAWQRAVENASHFIDYQLLILRKKYNQDERAFGLAVDRELLPVVARISNRIDRSYFIKKISAMINIEEAELRDIVEERIRHGSFLESNTNTAPAPMSVNQNETKPDSKENIQVVDLPYSERIIRRIIGLLLFAKNREDLAACAVMLSIHFEELTDKKCAEHFKDTDTAVEALAFEAEMHYSSPAHFEAELKELLISLETIKAEQNLVELLSQLRRAELAGDEHTAEEILRKYQKAAEHIAKIKKHKFEV